jgi:tetratricopeptide (TPR) repeat protein
LIEKTVKTDIFVNLNMKTLNMKRILVVCLLMASVLLKAQTYNELVAKGDEFYGAKNYAEAIKFFTQAIALEPNFAKGYWYRGDANRELKSLDEALNDYTIAIDLEPKNAKFRKLRGDTYYSLKQYAQAEKDYGKGIELDPKNATLWLYRGDCYALLKQNDKACTDYKKAQELGSRNAKSQAAKITCSWVSHMVGNTPCPTGDAVISKIEMDPLTGAVFTSKGLTYDKYEIKTEAGVLISGPEVAMGETIVITLTNPKGFCTDTDGVVFMGVGHETKEIGGRELDKVHNQYKEGQSFPPDQTKTISIKFKVAAPMLADKNYDMKAHFFDSKGNGELFVEMPIKTAPKTLTATNITSGTAGAGIVTGAVGGEIKGMELHSKHHGGATAFNALESNHSYTITASDVKGVNKHSHVMFRFVDASGTVSIDHRGKAVFHGEHVKVDFSTEGLKPGNYTMWMKIQEEGAPQNIGILVPITVK